MTQPILVFKNPDKNDHKKAKDPLLPGPEPWRMCVVGPPSSGKRVQILNIILRLPKFFDRIVIIHLDESTTEWNDLNASSAKGCDTEIEIFTPDETPGFEDFSGSISNLMVIDEVNFSAMSKKKMAVIERLFGYASSHKNLSIVLCYQNFQPIPVTIRRLCNHFILFKNVDANQLTHIANRIAAPVEDLREIMGTILKSPHDSLWVDTTKELGSPYRYRLNLWTPIIRRIKK